MSTLRVNRIVNANDNGPVEFSRGVTVPSGQSITGNIVFNTSAGVVTATTFRGVGAGITTFGVQNEIRNSKAIAFTLIT